MKRLSNTEWSNIFRNMLEIEEDERMEFGEWIEIQWLEGNGVDTFHEWVLCYAYEVFEDGFKTEKDAQKRLTQLESELL